MQNLLMKSYPCKIRPREGNKGDDSPITEVYLFFGSFHEIRPWKLRKKNKLCTQNIKNLYLHHTYECKIIEGKERLSSIVS